MTVNITLIDGPVPNTCRTQPTGDEAGALACFDGIVRRTEEDRPLDGLMYEAYRPMADRMLAELARQVRDEFGLLAIEVHHSVGLVRVGECSFRLRVCAAHRGEALQAMIHFIDRMKQTVPLWKTPVWASTLSEVQA